MLKIWHDDVVERQGTRPPVAATALKCHETNPAKAKGFNDMPSPAVDSPSSLVPAPVKSQHHRQTEFGFWNDEGETKLRFGQAIWVDVDIKYRASYDSNQSEGTRD